MSGFLSRQSLPMISKRRVHSILWILLGVLTQFQFQQVASITQVHFSSKHTSHASPRHLHTTKTETNAVKSKDATMESKQQTPDATIQVSNGGNEALIRSAKLRRHPQVATSAPVRNKGLPTSHTVERVTARLPRTPKASQMEISGSGEMLISGHSNPVPSLEKDLRLASSRLSSHVAGESANSASVAMNSGGEIEQVESTSESVELLNSKRGLMRSAKLRRHPQDATRPSVLGVGLPMGHSVERLTSRLPHTATASQMEISGGGEMLVSGQINLASTLEKDHVAASSRLVSHLAGESENAAIAAMGSGGEIKQVVSHAAGAAAVAAPAQPVAAAAVPNAHATLAAVAGAPVAIAPVATRPTAAAGAAPAAPATAVAAAAPMAASAPAVPVAAVAPAAPAAPAAPVAPVAPAVPVAPVAAAPASAAAPVPVAPIAAAPAAAAPDTAPPGKSASSGFIMVLVLAAVIAVGFAGVFLYQRKLRDTTTRLSYAGSRGSVGRRKTESRTSDTQSRASRSRRTQGSGTESRSLYRERSQGSGTESVALPTTEEDAPVQRTVSQPTPTKDNAFRSFAERVSEGKLQTQSGGNSTRSDPLQKIVGGVDTPPPRKTSTSRLGRKANPDMLSNQLLEDEDEDFTI